MNNNKESANFPHLPMSQLKLHIARFRWPENCPQTREAFSKPRKLRTKESTWESFNVTILIFVPFYALGPFTGLYLLYAREDAKRPLRVMPHGGQGAQLWWFNIGKEVLGKLAEVIRRGQSMECARRQWDQLPYTKLFRCEFHGASHSFLEARRRDRVRRVA